MIGDRTVRDNRPSELTGTEFVEAINHFPTGVAIVTTSVDGAPTGATVASVMAAAAEPPMLTVAMMRGSRTAAAVLESGVFAVHVVEENAASLAGRFASASANKFEGLDARTDEHGSPWLPDAVARFSCRLAIVEDVGSHLQLLAHVDTIDTRDGLPLVYFRGAFARLTTEVDAAVLRDIRSRVLAIRSALEETLDPTSLARELGVQVGTVIRTLSTLASESLVRRRDGVYTVVPVPPEVVDAAYDAKLTIELGVAMRTVGRLEDDELALLRAKAAGLRAIAQSGDYRRLEEYVQAREDIESYFVSLAGSPALVEAYRALSVSGIDRRTMDERIFAQLPRSVGFLDIVAGYESGDLEAVLAALSAEHRHPRYVRGKAAAAGE